MKLLKAVAWLSSVTPLVALACSGPEDAARSNTSGAPVSAERPDTSHALHTFAFDRAHASLGGPRDQVELLGSRAERLPVSGQVRYRYMFHSRATGQVAPVDLDASGQPVDDAAVREAERQARWARFGHLRPKLAERIERLSDEQKLWVVLYLPVPDAPDGASAALRHDEQRLAAEQARVESEVEHARQRLLAATGEIEAVPAADGSPWLRVQVTVAQLKQLSRSDLVGAIFDAEERPRKPATNADHYVLSGIDVAHNTYGALGSGIRVATLNEIVAPNANLPFDPYGSRAMYPLKSPCNEACDTHGAHAMGYIQNTNPSDLESPPLGSTGGKKGVAPLATLYNASVSEVVGTLIRS